MNATIPATEFDKRCLGLQASMQEEGMDALIIYSWKRGQVRYVSGYHPGFIANAGIVVLPSSGKSSMIIRFPFDIERAHRESWIENIEASGNIIDMAPRVARIIQEMKLADKRIGIVSGDYVMNEMSYELYGMIKQLLPKAQFVDASHLLAKARLIKSDREFSLLRESACLADEGVKAVSQFIQPGKTEYEIVAAAECKMRSLGAEMHLVTISSDGLNKLIGPPTTAAIKVDSNVMVEIAVQKNGYMTQVAQTYFIGSPKAEQTRILNATYSAYLAGVAAAKPGLTCRDVAKSIHLELSKFGFGDYMEHDLGHSIGIDLPENPRIEFGDTTAIEPGMVLVIHPSIRVPGVGGAFIGGTVLIHQDKTEPIHHFNTYAI